MKTLLVLFALAVLRAGPAIAAESASVIEVRGAVRITTSTAAAARPAAAGDTVGEKDLVLVPEGGAVTLRLVDGSETRVEGKAIVSGKRLRGRNAAAFNAIAARSVDLVTHEIETAASTTALAIRGDEAEAPELGESVRAPRGMTFLGEDGESRRRSEVDYAEFSLRKGEFPDAERRAAAVLADNEALHDERRRAHRVLAFVAMSGGDAHAAAQHLDEALANATSSDGRPVLDALRVERARARVLLGDDGGAAADLRVALESGGDPARRMEAHFLLGILALGSGDVKGAKKQFASLENAPALESAAQEAIDASTRRSR